MKNDRELLASACRGDLAAQNELFATRIDPLVRLAYLITRDFAAAEDAVQEALISTTRHLPTLREQDRFDAWLKRIVVNQAKTFRRRSGRVIPAEDVTIFMDADSEGTPGPESILLQRERQLRVMAAVDKLNDRLRVPIFMKYYLDMKEREIARVMRLPVSTIKARLHAARKKLKTTLEKEDWAHERLQ